MYSSIIFSLYSCVRLTTQIAYNITTQEYRKNGMKRVSNPVYDQGIKQNFINELFTFHPSLLASTVITSNKRDVEVRVHYSLHVCYKHENNNLKDGLPNRKHVGICSRCAGVHRQLLVGFRSRIHRNLDCRYPSGRYLNSLRIPARHRSLSQQRSSKELCERVAIPIFPEWIPWHIAFFARRAQSIEEKALVVGMFQIGTLGQ